MFSCVCHVFLVWVTVATLKMKASRSFLYDSEAEFLGSCINQPCVHGLCLPLPMGNYRCYCQSGFTGLDCQTNYDECRSNPCENEATCIDGIDSFTCACLEGFTGTFCETNINECLSNPCENGGTCEDLVDGYVCHCILAYDGINCERYFNICDTENNGEVCQNDGLCILLPGNFYTCRCPPNYFGNNCELLDCPCVHGGICVYGLNVTCICPFGWTGKTCETKVQFCDDEICSNKGLCVVNETIPGKNESFNTTCFCVPDYHGEFCESRYDECLPQSFCSNGSTCIDDVDGYSCICPDSSTGIYCNETIDCEKDTCYSTVDSVHSSSTTDTSFDINTSQDVSYLISSPANLQSSQSSISVPFTLTTTELILSSRTRQYDSVTSTFDTMGNSLVSPTQMSSSVPVSSSSVKETQLYTSSSASNDVITTSFISARTEPLVSDVSFSTSFEAFYTTAVATKTEKNFSPTASFEQTASNAFSTFLYSVSPTNIINPSSFSSIAPTSKPSLPNPCHNFKCENGGTKKLKLTKNNGVHQYECECLCKLLYTGERCERQIYLLIPQFHGHSFLVHSLPEITSKNNLEIDVSFKTGAMSGIIFFTEAVSGGSFLLLYIDAGMLKLSFSCGHQTTVFIETHALVNNNYFTSVSVMLSWSSVIPRVQNASCSVGLLVNGSIPMNGEQFVLVPTLNFRHIYLGGLHPELQTSVIDVQRIPSFRGCVIALQVNGLERDLIYEAEDGAFVTECYASACYQNPCLNGAICRNFHDRWLCDCPEEFSGPLCEHRTCLANPCQSGGTCLPDAYTGHTCLCPYGKYGPSCEHGNFVRRPAFSENMFGYSSFIEYEQTLTSRYHFELRMAFATKNLLQKSLLLFQGQLDNFQLMSDFFAVGLDDGYVVYMFNLGSGTRLLKSINTIHGNVPVHHILIGRHKRYGWLKLDSQPKVMGLAAGQLTALNVPSRLFVGGHSSFNFSSLPVEVKTWTGFEGCVLDVQTRTSPGGNFVSVNRIVNGRNIVQCDVLECDLVQCFNGGTCIDADSSFLCECPKGYTGSLCEEVETPCSTNRHQCAAGSDCVSLNNEYRCDCPFEKSGKYCEKNIAISVPYFDGSSSFIEVPLGNIKRDMDIIVHVKPESEGLLFYTAQRMDKTSGDFVSLALSSGLVLYRFNLGLDHSRTTLLSTAIDINEGSWHTIKFGRYKRAAYLQVDDDPEVTHVAPMGKESLDVTTNIFLGGLPNKFSVSYELLENERFFKGCISYMKINGKGVSFTKDDIVRGRNVKNCELLSCDHDTCHNNQSCVWQGNDYKCICSEGHANETCDVLSNCQEQSCLNGATCNEKDDGYFCDCPIGWIGKQCEISANVTDSAYLNGRSYIYYKDIRNGDDFSITNISFAFSTNTSSGLLFWNGKAYSEDGDYLGAGLLNEQLHLVWSLGWQSKNEIVTNNIISNGDTWNFVHIERIGKNLTLTVNNDTYRGQVDGGFHELNTQDFHFGGFPNSVNIEVETGGFFTLPFIGCFKDLMISSKDVFIQSDCQGQNVEQCS